MSEPAIHYINMGMWPVYVGVTSSKKSFSKEMKRLKIKNVPFLLSETAAAKTHMFSNQESECYIICIKPFDVKKVSREVYAALVAHEAVHVMQDMRDRLAKGESLGCEAEAYLVQQIVQEALQQTWNSNMRRRTEPTP